MNATELHKRIPLKWWVGLTAVLLLVVLLVGLKPKDISPPNHAQWIKDRPGLRFERYGIAYTDSISDLIRAHISPGEAFSIEVALAAKNYSEDGFHFILLLHGGQDGGQLLVGQWRSSLIVMNGDDYSHRRKTDRITTSFLSEFPETQFVTITTGSKGTSVYLNGELAGAKKEMRLKMPEGETTRLLLGNSVYGNHPWEGDIYGVAVFEKTLSESEAEIHFNAWSEKQDFSFAETLAPVILYNLNGQGTTHVTAFSGKPPTLHTPSRMKILIPSFFFQKWTLQRINKNLYKDKDALLNFFGFIPLGLLLGATLIKRGGRAEAHCVSISLSVGFFMSLWIETVQAWMPARSSDILDLILNTAGTLVGAFCCWYLLLKRKGTEAQRHRGTR